MSDKDSAKTMPHVRISVQIGYAALPPPVIPKRFSKPLTEGKNRKNDTETLHKNSLSHDTTV